VCLLETCVCFCLCIGDICVFVCLLETCVCFCLCIGDMCMFLCVSIEAIVLT
jgi:hypothetical protein